VSDDPLADAMLAELRSLATLQLRMLAIHVVDADSFEFYKFHREAMEVKFGPLDLPWPTPPP
jgi:hypothetical protein